MKVFNIVCVVALAAGLVQSTAFAANLADLMNPDDVMLRKPAQSAEARKKADEERARADIERRFQEAKARAEAEQRAAEEAAAKKAAVKKAAEEAAAAKKAAEEAAAKKAAEEAAAAKKAAEEAAAKKAAEEAAAKKAAEEAAAAKKAAEEAAAAKKVAEEAAAAKKAAEEETAKLRAQVEQEKAAREKAEAAAKKAEAEKAGLQKRAAYLANPDPDERPAKPVQLKPQGGQADVTATTPSVVVTKKGTKGKKKLSGRAAIITADRTDYDRKEGVILFDRNVCVDDEQYKMHADRLFVFLDGTNDLKRLVALGNVAITNEARTASCARAVYTKAASRIVMYGEEGGRPAELSDGGGRKGQASSVKGKRITYWLDTGAATVEGVSVEMPAMKGGNSPKSLFNIGTGKDE